MAIPPLDIKEALETTFGGEIGFEEFRGELTAFVPAEQIAEVAEYCRDTQGLQFNLLSDIAALDYYPTEPRFGVCYHLYSIPYGRRLRLKVLWSDGDDPIPTVTGVWPSANWEEREAYDMFGILFDGHPDLRRILMPPDWEGHPQRRDYPLGYETVQFSFNADEVDKHKPYAKK
jgi:NADH-quinone oxidoreductase subunit C